MTARSAAVFCITVWTTVPQLSWKFQVLVTKGQVTRSGQVTPPPKKRYNRVMATVVERNIWNFQDLVDYQVQVSRISVVGLTYLAKPSLSVAVSRSMHDKYVRITKPHRSAKWLQHTSTVSGVICQKADFRTFLPWSAHSAWHRLWRHYRHPV